MDHLLSSLGAFLWGQELTYDGDGCSSYLGGSWEGRATGRRGTVAEGHRGKEGLWQKATGGGQLWRATGEEWWRATGVRGTVHGGGLQGERDRYGGLQTVVERDYRGGKVVESYRGENLGKEDSG